MPEPKNRREGQPVKTRARARAEENDDPVEDESRAREVAVSLGAHAEVLPGLGHWWMFDTDQVAKTLTWFWDSLNVKSL